MKVFEVTVSFLLSTNMCDQQVQVFSDKDYAKHIFDEKVNEMIATVANSLHGEGLPVDEDKFEYREGDTHGSEVLAQWKYGDKGRFARVSLKELPLLENTLNQSSEEIDVFLPETEAEKIV